MLNLGHFVYGFSGERKQVPNSDSVHKGAARDIRISADADKPWQEAQTIFNSVIIHYHLILFVLSLWLPPKPECDFENFKNPAVMPHTQSRVTHIIHDHAHARIHTMCVYM